MSNVDFGGTGHPHTRGAEFPRLRTHPHQGGAGEHLFVPGRGWVAKRTLQKEELALALTTWGALSRSARESAVSRGIACEAWNREAAVLLRIQRLCGSHPPMANNIVAVARRIGVSPCDLKRDLARFGGLALFAP